MAMEHKVERHSYIVKNWSLTKNMDYRTFRPLLLPSSAKDEKMQMLNGVLLEYVIDVW